jgi:hypothetical protein
VGPVRCGLAGSMRVLVTGSRTWPYPLIITGALIEAWTVRLRGDEFIVVHGHCKKGADAMADRICAEQGFHVERHPANWQRDGKQAGFIRNIEMVQAGADVCLAFIHNASKGATHCADAAQAAGIPVRRYEC